LNFSRLHVHNFNCDLLKSTFCDLLSLCTQRFIVGAVHPEEFGPEIKF